MSDIRGIVLQKILLQEEGFLDAWSNLKLSYFGTEYAPVYRAISKFYINHSNLPTFEDLDLHNRNPVLRLSLEALKVTDPIDVTLDLAVEALINQYTQEEVLNELDVFLDEITFLGASEIKQELGNILLSIEEKTLSSEEIVLMSDIQYIKEPELLGLMPLGLNNSFDAKLGGMAPTEMLGIGGERGSGKSNVCTNLLVNQYLSGNSSLYFSIEMRAREVFNRTLSLLTGVDLAKLSLAELTNPELQKIAKVRSEMFLDANDLYENYLEHNDYEQFERELVHVKDLKPENQMIIVDNQHLTLANIDLTVHKYKTQFEDKLKLVVVDYLNQIDMEDKYAWKNQIEMSSQLKAIARKYDIILVTPYQIDKTGEARFSKGILDGMDIAMILEKSEGRIDFTSTKTRGKKKFEFASPVDENTMRIDANDFNLPPKDSDKPKEGEEPKEKDKDLPW
jgi:replicative DNA helicase